MYLFYGIDEDDMWPNAEGRWIHFTKGVSSHQCHLYNTRFHIVQPTNKF